MEPFILGLKETALIFNRKNPIQFRVDQSLKVISLWTSVCVCVCVSVLSLHLDDSPGDWIQIYDFRFFDT